MGDELQRTVGVLFHGWVQILVLIGVLTVLLFILGLAFNRQLRPMDRMPALSWAVALPAYALAILLHHFEHDLRAALLIAAAVIIGGLVGRARVVSALWITSMIMAALVGLGYWLSAFILFFAGLLVLIILPSQGR